MSSVFVVSCPTCGMGLNAPEEFLGREVRCPGCQTVFTPSAPPSPSPGGAPGNGPEQTIADARPGDGLPPAPRPGGILLDDDEGPEEEDRPWEQRDRWGGPRVRRDSEPHRGTLILVLGIVSVVMFSFCGLIGLPLGIMALVMGRRDLKKMSQGEMDPAGEGNTRAGMICGIIGTVLNAIWTVGCGMYVVFEIALVSMIVSSTPSRPPGPPVGPVGPGNPPPIVVPDNPPPKPPDKGGPEGP
jgi:hypothetical protein